MTKYEYIVTGEYTAGVPVKEVVESRELARKIKKEFKEVYDCPTAQITQRKFKLEEQKVIR